MVNINLTHADVLNIGLRAFDKAVYAVRVSGIPHDAPAFRSELAEQLAGAACTWWYRAVEAAPVLLDVDARIITRALSTGTKAARKSAVAEIERTSCLGDMSPLLRQDWLRVAGPRLALAKMLLQMAEFDEIEKQEAA